MISPRTKPCRKECLTPKKLEGYRSGRGRQYNPYRDHWLRLWYTTIEERTQPTGAYIYYTTYFFVQFFSLSNYSIRDPIYICPRFFYFATHIRDPISRLPFAAPFRDSHSRLTFATHVHDYTSDSHSRLTFATTLATPFCDLRLRPHSRLLFTTPDHAPNCDLLFFIATPPLTDGLC